MASSTPLADGSSHQLLLRKVKPNDNLESFSATIRDTALVVLEACKQLIARFVPGTQFKHITRLVHAYRILPLVLKLEVIWSRLQVRGWVEISGCTDQFFHSEK